MHRITRKVLADIDAQAIIAAQDAIATASPDDAVSDHMPTFAALVHANTLILAQQYENGNGGK